MSRTSQRSTFRVLAGMVIPVYRLFARSHWRGRENFPDSGGFVVVANHLTELDPITVAYPVYASGIMPRFLAKESLFRVPVVGTIIAKIGQVPVYRGTSRAKDSLVAALAELDSGGAVIVYPEGTITLDPRMWPMRGRTGAARLALEAGVPVVPMAHWGDQEILYRDPSGHRTVSLWPRKRVDVIVGEPMHPEDLVPGGLQRPGHPSADELNRATRTIMATIADLTGQLRGEPAPRELFDPRAGAARSDDAARTSDAESAGNAAGALDAARDADGAAPEGGLGAAGGRVAP
ncbi:lysophospholipid acyltransferase family protein [Kocuria marina]|uniref:lysophospholipid acyltransferase family protein n=1 Tax=Kocuria marina TaxID=223184 RepID=UPI0022DEABE7|nr:lysophospholipid acyltransferase family protein [Kocuria marina]